MHFYYVWDGKYSDNSRVAKLLVTANKDKPKHSSYRNEEEGEKKLLTFGRPQGGKNLLQEIPSTSTASP